MPDDKNVDLLPEEEAFVDPVGLGYLCEDVQDYMIGMKSAMSPIDDLVEDCSNFYIGDTFSTFVEKKSSLKLSTKNILNNVNSFIDDYNFVLSKFKNEDTSISSTVHVNVNIEEEK